MDKGKKYKVLYLSYDGMTDPLGQSQVLPYIKGLSEHNIDFDLISFEKKGVFEERKNDIKEFISDYAINWFPESYTKSPPILSTIYDVYRLFKKVEALHLEKKYSLIHCRGYITSLVGLKMKQKYGVPFVFDMRAFYADERIDGGHWNLDNPVYNKVYDFFKKKEKDFIKYSDYTISLTEKGKDIIKNWEIVDEKNLKVQVIPCCADLDLFNFKNIDSTSITEARKRLKINDSQKVVSYLGSVGTWYLPNEMMLFFKQFLKKHEESIFLFITNEPLSKLKALAEKLDVPSSKIRAISVNHKEVPLYLSLSDYALFFIKPVFSKSGSSPTKMAEIMGLGIPLVCNAGVGDVDLIVEDTKCGVCVSSFDDKTFDEAISTMEASVFEKEKIRKGAYNYYNLEAGVEKYFEVYDEILKIE